MTSRIEYIAGYTIPMTSRIEYIVGYTIPMTSRIEGLALYADTYQSNRMQTLSVRNSSA